MQLGLFLPTATNGQIASTTTPQFEPTFDNILEIVTTAERFGIDFGLSLAKLHGFGGPSRFWDSSLDPFTTVAALIARTSRIKLFATAPILAMPPAMAARAGATIDSIAPGRFGINIVTGWQRAEYDTMGMWPGDEHYANRYAYAAEYVTVLRELWSTGRSDFDGQYFHMKGCRVEPQPRGLIDIVSAGQSDAGLEFAAGYADYSFITASGINTPQSVAALAERTERAEAAAGGRSVGTYPLVLVIADETDEAAWAKWERWDAGVDDEALAWAKGQASMDKKSAAQAQSTAKIFQKQGDSAMGLGRLIGSYENVARMLDEIAAQPRVSGLMLALGDWFNDVEMFGTRIQPLMRSRQAAKTNAEAPVAS